jgi:hypothetical protein
MKKLFFTLLLSGLASGAFVQKIAVQPNLITVDAQPYARFEPGDPEAVKFSSLYYLTTLQNERLLVVKVMSFHDPAAAWLQNPTGSTAYLQFFFPGTHTVVELPWSGEPLRPIELAREVYAARLLKNGKLDPQAVSDFALLNGRVYTERRLALNQLPMVAPSFSPPPVINPKPN